MSYSLLKMLYVFHTHSLYSHISCQPVEKPNLEEDNDGADEHADALEKVSHHVDKGRSHTGVVLLNPPSWKTVVQSIILWIIIHCILHYNGL